MKLPRNISARKLILALSKLGYEQTRQTGSHIRLTRHTESGDQHLTIPEHNPLKIGTLNSILNRLSTQSNVEKEKLIELLS